MKRLNPCKLKGQYLARGRSGRRGAGGVLQKLSCCECMRPLLSLAATENEFLRYKMQAKAGAAQFLPTTFDAKEIKGETFSVPCSEIFRDLKSVGTRRYKRALKDKTKFTGCESLEMDLVKNGLVRHFEPNETNPFLDANGDEGNPASGLSLTAFSRLNLGQKLATLRDQYPDQNLLFDEEASTTSVLAPELTMQNLMAARPADLQAVTLMKLYEEGMFDQFGEEVKATAYLIFKGITNRPFIKTAFPKYPAEKFSSLCKQVFEIYRENRSRDEIVFEKFNKALTTKQRKALQLVYMSEEPKSYTEAAKQLGISVDTLRNRIDRAIDKLKAAFPEYAALKKKRTPSNFKTDLAYDGLYRKSSARLVRPIKRQDRETKTWKSIDMEEFLRSRMQKKKQGATEAK